MGAHPARGPGAERWCIVVAKTARGKRGEMKLFIDSDIALEMYKSPGHDLEPFRTLVRLLEAGRIDLLLSQQVIDGFWRDRERVIADALSLVGGSGAQAGVPGACRSHVNTAVKQDRAADTCEADRLAQQLFATALPESIEAFVSAARLRTDIGNPPGGPGRLGPAVNWEWLLNRGISLDTTEIVILSTDVDLVSPLVKGQLKEFLRLEWATRHPYCALRLEHSVEDLLLRDFPDVTRADETQNGLS